MRLSVWRVAHHRVVAFVFVVAVIFVRRNATIACVFQFGAAFVCYSISSMLVERSDVCAPYPPLSFLPVPAAPLKTYFRSRRHYVCIPVFSIIAVAFLAALDSARDAHHIGECVLLLFLLLRLFLTQIHFV